MKQSEQQLFETLKIANHHIPAQGLRCTAELLFPGVNPIVIGRKEYGSNGIAQLYEEHDLDQPVLVSHTNWQLLEKMVRDRDAILSRMIFVRDRGRSSLLRIDHHTARRLRALAVVQERIFPRVAQILRVPGVEHIRTDTCIENGWRIMLVNHEDVYSRNKNPWKTNVCTLFDSLDEVGEWTGVGFELDATRGDKITVHPAKNPEELDACYQLKLNNSIRG